jgi:class 3 adenylate cyclase
MFCDLVGSTPLAARYDPEDLREVTSASHRCVADTVARFAGFAWAQRLLKQLVPCGKDERASQPEFSTRR